MLAVGVLLSSVIEVSAQNAAAISPVRMDPDKLAGINLPAGEPFVPNKDLLDGNHEPKGEVLFYGEQLVAEVYEDRAATMRMEPFTFDEFVLVLSGKLVLTNADGVTEEFVAGDSLVVPKGLSGTWKMEGNYRELVVIEREAYEAEFGTGE